MLKARPDLRLRPPLEGQVQHGIIDLFRRAGVHVGSTSQYRQSHVEEGIPDLMCHALAIGVFYWFEVKSYVPSFPGPVPGPKGHIRFNPFDRATWVPRELSEKQLEFRRRALACGVKHFFGGMPQAENALIELGLGRRAESGVFLLLPRGTG